MKNLEHIRNILYDNDMLLVNYFDVNDKSKQYYKHCDSYKRSETLNPNHIELYLFRTGYFDNTVPKDGKCFIYGGGYVCSKKNVINFNSDYNSILYDASVCRVVYDIFIKQFVYINTDSFINNINYCSCFKNLDEYKIYNPFINIEKQYEEVREKHVLLIEHKSKVLNDIEWN